MTAIIDDHLYDEIRAGDGPTKHCTGCDTDHPIEAFAFKSKAHRKLHSRCRLHNRMKNRARYEQTADARRDAVRQRRREMRHSISTLIGNWCIDRTCTSCGSTTNLCAVSTTGRSLKQLHKDGWGVAAIEAALATATAVCTPCQQSPRRPLDPT